MTLPSTTQRVLLQTDFDRFARLSHDDNPIHCDPDFAARSHFGATVAHGMMLYSCICKALTEQVGPGVVQLEQTLMFPNATYVGDRLHVGLKLEAEIAGVLDIATELTKVGADGTAMVTAGGRCRVVEPAAALPGVAPAPHPAEEGDAELYGLRPGMNASTTRTFATADLDEYGDLTGDRNPIFRDDLEARARGFKRRIVPWPLLAGMFSDLLGTRLPGRGTGWMKQQLRYPSAAHPGEALTATVTITRLRAAKELVNLSTRVCAADGRLVCDGEALVLVRNLESKLAARTE
jgi:acyl dehydratase